MQEDLISVKQAADELGITPQTIHKWIKLGLIEALRMGPRLVKVKRSSLSNVFSSIGPAEDRSGPEGNRNISRKLAPEDERLTTTEAAAAIGLKSQRGIIHAIKRGDLKAEKINGQWRIAPEEIDAYKKRQNIA